MKSLIAFTKKEAVEQIRSGRLAFIGIIFILLGIMNPAVAKLTPWLLEIMADSLAESGMTVTGVTVSALDSWVQFSKNLPIGLIAFVLLESNLFTKEYTSGTLILSLTKGLERYKVIISKSTVLYLLWTACYWMCFAITYAYNAYFWDNSAAKNLIFAVICQWLFGMFIISLTVFFSTVANSNTGVLIGCGGTFLASYLAALIPKVNKFLPTRLIDTNSLIYGTEEAEAYIVSIVITSLLCLACFAVSIPIFNKKQL